MCEAHDHDTSAQAAESTIVECPVMRGTFVDTSVARARGLVREHEGTTYFLCCAACGPLFDADPQRYAAAA